MAPLPSNNTPVIYVDYTTGRLTHQLQVRVVPGSSAQTWDTEIATFLGALAPILPQTWEVLGCRSRGAGGVVTTPLNLPAVEAIGGTSSSNLSEVEEAREVTWQGRSFPGGRRVDVSLYGAIFATPSRYRINDPAPTGGFGLALQALINAAAAFRAIDGLPALWKNFVNVNYNSTQEYRLRYG